jgi:hypothetical protein
MRIIRQVFLILSMLLVMAAGGTAFTAQAAIPTTMAAASAPAFDSHGDRPYCPTRDRSADTNTFIPPPLQTYYLGDWRLGPEQLPRTGPIGQLLRGYERLDDLSASAFLACYWNTATNGWWFPDQDGYVLKNGQPVKRQVTLEHGQKLDLFGSGLGRFLAPAGTPYENRAVPPSNLDTSDPNYPFGYHLYEVVIPFTVDAGPIRPWFGQPGLGLQYVLNSHYIPGAPADVRIPYLVQNGYLRTLN